MKVRRDISSIPVRTAESTWSVIQNLITGEKSKDTEQLDKAASTLHSLITDELFVEHPITVAGVGPRLVIYLRYRSEALEEGETIDPLDWNPTAGDWKMYVPCDDENIEWVKKTLAARAPRIVVHTLGERLDESAADKGQKSEKLEIDWGVVG